MPSLLIVVATYNEIENLPSLVQQLNETLPDADILVIDDGSPDGTGQWCDQASSHQHHLSVIHRPRKSGLGSAATLGFNQAIAQGYDLVATMDADLSHDPNSLSEMVTQINDPANDDVGVILGSRYVTGGGVEGWPLLRRIASRTVNAYAKRMLGLSTNDNSGAFRVYRVKTLAALDPNQLKSSDFAYLEEILWRLKKQRVHMTEHPIIFRNREHGKSKTSLVLGLKVFWQITMMGCGRWK